MSQFMDSLLSTVSGFSQAALVTLQLTIVSLIIASFIGLIVALMKLSNTKPLNWIANIYIGIIRGTPLIVQIMWLYFGITQIVVLSAFWAGSIALAIHSGAYIAEIFRGAIQSIDKGQMEAAESLGMTKRQAMFRIIFPQAFKRSIPPLGNQFIIGLKDSSLVAFIGITEIFNLSMSQAAATFRQLEFYTIAGVYYLILVVIFTIIVNKIEKRLDTGRA
ncbi:amino acid ABC transporter permease [Pseudogracilibacillus auburnensis]|uniref:Amino acid ABC transporter membrane protein (PAAT family) n=1 Tax=Pseudogracilibacillus auburnensis TaxID=1494959 RepID=A0A2V3W9P5_9BACI|nr:amino acid ABC transporter permease [Pseudogracilibacillus auburnensis]MBO1002028.1 amino acid ABC transporter permease [Pseudogracilibacillus auburnensis]PXW90256.1 amino acid ABC transporter membrane protein (PAAT family) [Pseudogracilibacillus auburnensis]